MVRRRTVPLYRHPCLRPNGQPVTASPNPEEGSITDGDDHVSLGDQTLLRRGQGGPGGAGWVGILDGTAMENLLKRKRESSDSSENVDGNVDGRRVAARVEGAVEGSAQRKTRFDEDEEREEVRVDGLDWKRSAS